MFFKILSLVIICLATQLATAWASPQQSTKDFIMTSPLSPAEEQILIYKGTEPPYSGKYLKHKEAGIYVCRQCGAALYPSQAKFDACGWPSFDSAIPGAVTQVPDADGKRTEITCTKCGGHLGHVFTGENLTPQNVRHCVNSVSMEFMPAKSVEIAYFAGGCFWGIEDAFSKIPGVIDAISGYMGGKTDKPTYEDVSSGRSQHAEVVQIVFDSSQVSYETLAKLFFEIHDPTQLNRQGVDVGTQYRSAVFYTSPEQKIVVDDLISQLQKKGLNVVTTVDNAPKFYAAENYHQDYTKRTGRGACHLRVKRFD